MFGGGGKEGGRESLSPTPPQGEKQVTVNAKGSDSQMISNLLDEVKAVV